MISARDLAGIAADVATVQPSTVAIRRAVAAPDGLGGVTNTYGTVATVAARVAPVSSYVAEQEVGERLRDAVVWRVSMPAGTDVRAQDRIVDGTTTYAVESVRTGGSVEIERVAYVTKAAR